MLTEVIPVLREFVFPVNRYLLVNKRSFRVALKATDHEAPLILSDEQVRVEVSDVRERIRSRQPCQRLRHDQEVLHWVHRNSHFGSASEA